MAGHVMHQGIVGRIGDDGGVQDVIAIVVVVDLSAQFLNSFGVVIHKSSPLGKLPSAPAGFVIRRTRHCSTMRWITNPPRA